MKRFILIGLLSFALPAVGFAEENPKVDFFEAVVGSRIDECIGHFDVQPYLILATGKLPRQQLPAEVVRSLESFAQTGRIELTDSQKQDQTAVGCATYAEGLIAGGLGKVMIAAVESAAHGKSDRQAGQIANQVADSLEEAFTLLLQKSAGGSLGDQGDDK